MEYPTRVVCVSSLVLDKEYPIVRVERVGDRLKIYFLDSPDYISQTFLPHSGVYSDEDLRTINSGHLLHSITEGVSGNQPFIWWTS
jgi:hypothetical protein